MNNYNIYLSSTNDGLNTEGIGSMAQLQLFTYGLAKSLNIKYAFKGFVNLHHYQYHPEFTSNTWSDKFTDFFNLPNELNFNEPYDVLQINNINTLLSTISNIKNLEKNLVISIIGSELVRLDISNLKKYLFEISDRIKHPFILDQAYEHVSVHARVFTGTDNDPNRDYYTDNKKDFYKKLVKNIFDRFTEKPKKLHIHSQVAKENFSYLDEYEPNFYINAYPWESISCMIQSNYLIGSASSFSYISHMLNKNKFFINKGFYHSLYDDCIIVDVNGNFKI